MYHVIPTHQGRAAEHLLMQAMVGRGRQVIGNTHFDTTRANIEALGATAVDLPTPKLKDDQDGYIFKGDIDLEALQRKLESDASDVDMCIITVTNNSVGGLPVSMANIKSAQKLLNSHGVPLVIDCARFAENAYFIKTHEPGYQTKSIRQIVEEMFRLADAAVMSSKKDAIANIGGFIAVKDATVANEIRTRMVLTEGFPTYGGLAGRDMEAVAIGLEEALDENYLAYRIRSVAYFGEGLEKMGYSVVRPFGGHAVYINAGLTLRHLRPLDYPGQSLAVALYEALGLRSVEVGSVMLGRRDPRTGEEHAASRELVRLALPRRVYTQSHVDYMIEAAGHLHPHLESLPGYSFDYQAPFLRHFSARFRPKS
jgi:tryptophanase